MTLPGEVIRQAARDERVTRRYWSHVLRTEPGECWLWTGAISGQGHGRFWIADGRVVIAHRFAWALAHLDDELPPMLRHDCDNPLCQNPGHLRVGDHTDNRRDYFARRGVPGSPLNDPRGSRARARAMRDAARDGLDLGHVLDDGLTPLDRDQPPLW